MATDPARDLDPFALGVIEPAIMTSHDIDNESGFFSGRPEKKKKTARQQIQAPNQPPAIGKQCIIVGRLIMCGILDRSTPAQLCGSGPGPPRTPRPDRLVPDWRRFVVFRFSVIFQRQQHS